MICENCMRTLLENIQKQGSDRSGNGCPTVFEMCTNMRWMGGKIMWYNYKDYLINIDKIVFVEKDPADAEYPSLLIQSEKQSLTFWFEETKRRDEEFEKIKILVGIKDVV